MIIPDPGTDGPPAARNAAGIVSIGCSYSVEEAVDRVKHAISAAGAMLFAVIDQSQQANTAGLSLRETRLVMFGSPAAGTAVMTASPLAAIDLPLKILIWQDDLGPSGQASWMPTGWRFVFPVSEDPPTARREAAAALRLCAVCPVRRQCLELALRRWPVGQHGIWGGTLPGERRVLREHLASPAPASRDEARPCAVQRSS